MPDRRTRRGPHPKDRACFAPEMLPKLRDAVADLSLLLGRGYSANAATKLVGDRYALVDRQRRALGRCAAGAHEVERRLRHQIPLAKIANEEIAIDGYNVLLSVEAALDGGVVLLGHDGVYRDLAAMSGHYKRVASTREALALIGRTLIDHRCGSATWFFDRPVSNSGRLAELTRGLAAAHGWPWQVELIDRVDATLAQANAIVATADSAILDRTARWLNLARHVIDRHVPRAWIVDLSPAHTGDRAELSPLPQSDPTR